MKRKKIGFQRILAGVIAGLSIACSSANAQVVSIPSFETSAQKEGQNNQAKLLDEIDQYAKKVKEDWEVPGLAIAIVRNGKVIFSKGYGVLKLGGDQPVNSETQFAIASNSKAFTCAALAILVDQGKLNWDDKVTKHLPDFQMPSPFATREMTVRDLVCHRSGMGTFSGDLLWYNTNHSAETIVKRIKHLKPVRSFRSGYGYQNLMYIAAGLVIQKVSGKNWGQFMESEILSPLKMERTTTSITKLKSNFAMPHNKSGGDVLRTLDLGNVDNCWGACGLNSSVDDLAKWMIFLMNDGKSGEKQIISSDQVYQMQQPNVFLKISQAAQMANPTTHFRGYGHGFFLNDLYGRKMVSHGGGLDGMISQLAFFPEEDLGVVVLTNSESSASRYIRDRVLECFLGEKIRQDKSLIAKKRSLAAEERSLSQIAMQQDDRHKDTKPSLPLADYAGTYRCPLYGDVKIVIDDKKLVMKMVPGPRFIGDLEHWHHNTWKLNWRKSVLYDFPQGFVTFTLNGKAKVQKLVIDQPNRDFWFYELDLKKIPSKN